MARNSRTELKASMLDSMARQRSRAHGKVRSSERAMNRLVAEWAKKSGLDMKALVKLNAQRERNLKALVVEQKAKLSRFAAVSSAGIQARARSIANAFKKKDFFDVPTFTLDKPVRISSRPFSVLKSKVIKSFGSSAKFRVRDRQVEGFDRVKFIFEWPNKHDVPVEIDVVGVISAGGVFDLQIDGGFPDHWGWMFAFAQLAVGERRTELVVTDSWLLPGHIMGVNYTFIPFDGHASGLTFGDFSLQALRQPIGPGKVARIEVSILIQTDCDSGFTSNADFESGPLGAVCPLVVIRAHGLPEPSDPGPLGMVRVATRR